MPETLEIAERAARAGGAVLLQWMGKFRVREKGPRDLVTEADLASQERIRQLLANSCPEDDFLGEESPDLSLLERSTAVWVVDPLDGTTNYVHGMRAFSVSVARVESGKVTVGVVYDPCSDECFRAAAGQGATVNGQPLRVSGCQRLDEALVATSLPARVEPNAAEMLRFVRVAPHCQAVRRLGSAALNLCYVAAGRMDGYWATSVQAWDMAAGALLVQESGGHLTHFDGGPWSIFQPQFIAAATQPLHRQLTRLLHD